MYYRHKKYSIEKNQRNELIKKFDNYDIAGLGRINPKDARSILLTCGFSLDEALQIVAAADSEQRNNIRKEAFLEEIRLHLGRSENEIEIKQVFETIKELGRESEDSKVSAVSTNMLVMTDLKTVAAKLKEAITDAEMNELFEFADPTGKGAICFEDFAAIMKKTSIW